MITCVPVNDGHRAPCFAQSGSTEAIRFVLSPAEMNGHVFIHSGVKLLLYLADLCCLTCSPRSHFLSPAPARRWRKDFLAAPF